LFSEAANVATNGRSCFSVFTIGSPDIDIMFSNTLPSLEVAKKYYQIDLKNFTVCSISNHEGK
jgi:hypothetical protein